MFLVVPVGVAQCIAVSMKNALPVFFWSALIGFSIPQVAPAGDQSPVATGRGLAVEYPGDRNIAKDNRVLFAEDFEAGTLEEIARRWGEMSNKDGKPIAVVEEGPPGSPGKRALRITANLAKNTGGHLYTRFSREVDCAYARFYVKFPGPHSYIHHFVTLGGYKPPTRWPQGGAGERPQGNDRITVGIEPTGDHGRFAPPGIWNFYAYWHEMKKSADGRYWGNSLKPSKPAAVPRDQWQCVEVMLKLNSTPAEPDGALALWLDGRPVAHFARGIRRGPWTGMGFVTDENGEQFEGFRWRSDPALKVNFFWLMHYVTENAARQNGVNSPEPFNKVLFDHIVVATHYIGPLAQ